MIDDTFGLTDYVYYELDAKGEDKPISFAELVNKVRERASEANDGFVLVRMEKQRYRGHFIALKHVQGNEISGPVIHTRDEDLEYEIKLRKGMIVDTWAVIDTMNHILRFDAVTPSAVTNELLSFAKQAVKEWDLKHRN